MSFSLLYHTAAPRRNALSVRLLLQGASAMLLPEKTFPAVFRGEGRKEHEAPDRLSRRMSACGSAAAARAGCGGDRRRTDTRRGLGALTQRHAGRRAAFPRHAHAAYRRELDGTQRVFPRRRVSRAHGGPRRRRERQRLVLYARHPRSKESAFALHLAARFSARESVCLTVEWTARLDDGCVTGAEGNRVFLTAVSESGQTAASSSAAVFAYGFSVFRGVRFADARVADHPLPSACFRASYHCRSS